MSIHLLTDLLTYKIIPGIKMKYKNNSSTKLFKTPTKWLGRVNKR